MVKAQSCRTQTLAIAVGGEGKWRAQSRDGGNDGWLWWRWSRLRQRKLAAAVTLEAQATAEMIVGGGLRATLGGRNVKW